VAITSRPLATALALAALMAAAPTLHAVGFGDMFNPGRWFGGNNDDYDNDYYGGPYGPYGAGPYGPPGYGAYGVPGYGVPGYGYGAMPYGYAPGVAPNVAPGVAPGYAAPAAAAPAATAPAVGGQDAKDQEIEALKRRIDQLESRQSASPPSRSSGAEGWPSAPAFRPMDQY